MGPLVGGGWCGQGFPPSCQNVLALSERVFGFFKKFGGFVWGPLNYFPLNPGVPFCFKGAAFKNLMTAWGLKGYFVGFLKWLGKKPREIPPNFSQIGSWGPESLWGSSDVSSVFGGTFFLGKGGCNLENSRGLTGVWGTICFGGFKGAFGELAMKGGFFKKKPIYPQRKKMEPRWAPEKPFNPF